MSDLVLHCLPMSHKKDARLIWVKDGLKMIACAGLCGFKSVGHYVLVELLAVSACITKIIVTILVKHVKMSFMTASSVIF